MINVWTIRFKTVTQQTLNLRVRMRKIKITAMTRMTSSNVVNEWRWFGCRHIVKMLSPERTVASV